MKIVITGSRGFLGSHLVNALGDHQIIEWDNKIDKDINNFVLKSTVDFVVHLAALTDVRESIIIPEDYWRVNVEYSKKIFDICKNVPVIYASSSCAKEGWLSPYGTTKRVMEEVAHKGHVGLRFTNIYGDNAPDFMLTSRIKNGNVEYKTNHIRDLLAHDLIEYKNNGDQIKSVSLDDVEIQKNLDLIRDEIRKGKTLTNIRIEGLNETFWSDMKVVRSKYDQERLNRNQAIEKLVLKSGRDIEDAEFKARTGLEKLLTKTEAKVQNEALSLLQDKVKLREEYDDELWTTVGEIAERDGLIKGECSGWVWTYQSTGSRRRGANNANTQCRNNEGACPDHCCGPRPTKEEQQEIVKCYNDDFTDDNLLIYGEGCPGDDEYGKDPYANDPDRP